MKKPLNPRTLTLIFVITGLMIGWVGLGVYWSTHHLVQSFGSVSDSHQAIEKLQTIQQQIQAAENSAYNYVITGREERLDAYSRSRRAVPRLLREAEALLADHPRQKKTLRQFHDLYRLHQDYLAKIITARSSDGLEAAARWVVAEDDRSIRDLLEIILSDVQKEEGRILKRRSASSWQLAGEAKWTMGGAVALSLMLIGFVFALLRREARYRRRAENTNVRLETFLESIIERIPYLVMVKEVDTLRLTLVNKATTEWLGKSREDLLGSNDYDLWPRDRAREATERDREALRSGQAIDVPEESFRSASGDERILHTQRMAIPDEEGAAAHLLTIAEDITERKKAERMLELSRDAAVQSERLKSEFIRNMSHEIRTPLSVVLGMNALLLDTSLNDQQRAFAGKVGHAADGLVKLTKAILDFSKIENGTFALELQEMNLREMIEAILTMLKEQARIKGVGLVHVVPPSVPPALVGDPVRLRQVLTELIGNALKFTAKGEVIVRVQEPEQAGDVLWLTIKVSDTGPGIVADAKNHVFDAFRQGDGSPTRRFGGTGLGLAISKRIVELMGGSIGCESTLDEGSTFWCRIPFQKRASAPQSVNVATLPWTRARVLVIDENAVSRQQLRAHFSGWGLASEGVSTGEAALAMLRREQQAGRPFKIVLLDFHLMDMEATEFARTIRGEAALRGIQLVVLSETPLDPATSADFGFSACLSKPVQPQLLLDRLAGLVDTRQESQRPAA
jgi:PAS domain S-box-containing protein